MTAKDDLFMLIKSLSKTEKSYVKKYASIHSNEGKQQYLMLFDVLNEMLVYDEQEVKKKMGRIGIIQLSVYKNYLYKIILRSQAQYNRTHTKGNYLDELLAEIEILMKKNLFSQCLSLIQKAKNIANSIENFSSLLKVIHLEIRFIKQSPSVKNWQKVYEAAIEEEKEAIRKLAEISITRNLNAEMFLFLQQHAGNKSNETTQKELAELYARINTHTTHSSLECAINHLSAFVNYYKFNQEPEKAYPYQYQAIHIFEENTFLIENDPLRYVNSISNLLIIDLMRGNTVAFLQTLDKLKSLSKFIPKALISPNLELHIFALSMRHELSFYVKFKKYPEALLCVQTHEKKLLSGKNLITEVFFLQILYYNAYIYFVSNLEKDARYWLELIFDTPLNSYNQSLLFRAKVLHFMIFHQDENIEFIKSLFLSIQNFAKKHDIQAPLDIYLIRQIILLRTSPPEKQSHIRHKISDYIQKHPTQDAFFDFGQWWEQEENRKRQTQT